MSQFPNKSYIFDNFVFDAEKLALYHQDRLIKNTDTKSLQVLAVLLQNVNQLTSHDEIIQQVWKDNSHGVNSTNIAQYIGRLRKVLSEYEPEKSYIETVKGRGYSFVGDITESSPEISASFENESFESSPVLSESVLPVTDQRQPMNEKAVSSFSFPKPVFVLLLSIPIFLTLFLGWKWFSENDEEEIRQVVKESQLYESLVLYKNPASFNEQSFDKYWTPELTTNSNYDRRRIRDAVLKLNADGRQYGDETKCELFEFQSIEIDKNKDLAVVKTLEKWFITVYFNDGTLEKNKTVGPYFVSYIVRKIDGEWLIEKSTTGRVIRPTPHLSEIEAVSEIKSNQQFFVRITGQDFEPETVYIEVSGEGCPEFKPCKVPNTALRENAKLSENSLENVPLTLASGDFQIVVRNGDSKASNALHMNVP